MKSLKYIILLLLISLTSIFANVGTITALKGSATINRDAKLLTAKTGFIIEEKDIIKTALDAKMQIIFKDETIISLGKNTTFSVNEYLFEDDVEPVANFGIFKGAMRTITGKIGKIAPEKFKVKTKTASIGIRGTNFTVTILPNGSQKVFCTFGAIEVAINKNKFIVKQGFKIDITPKGKAEVKKFTPKELKKVNKESLGETKDKKKSSTKSTVASKESTSNSSTTNNDNETPPTSSSTTSSTSSQTSNSTSTAPISMKESTPTILTRTIQQPMELQSNIDVVITNVTEQLKTVTDQQKEEKVDEEEAARIAAEEEAARIAAEEEAARIAAEEEAARIAAEEEAARIAAEEEAARIAAEEEAARIAAEEEAARIAAEEEAARIAAEEEAARIAAEEEAARIAAEEEAAYTPPPAPPPPPPEPEIINLLTSTNGANAIQSIDEYAQYILPSIKLSITTTDSIASFDSANSFVKESSYDSTSNTVDWQYNLATTPISYSSLDNFQTTFSSVAVSNTGNYANARMKSGGINIFETQTNNTNFTTSSFTSWGRWELDILYDDTYNDTYDNEIKSLGYWITGIQIDPSIVSTITASGFSAIYDGKFIGYYFDTNNNNSATDTHGDATLNIDYANNSGKLILQNFLANNEDESIPIEVTNGKLISSDFGYLSASYYGDGTNISGSFKVMNFESGEVFGNGIFDVTQSAYELPIKLNGLSVSNITADKSTYWYEDININVLEVANKISYSKLKDQTDSTTFQYNGINLSSFVSKYEFAGELISADTENETVIPDSSSIAATATPNGSYMSWGNWAIDITYNEGSSTRTITNGLFVTGEITPSSILNLAVTNKTFLSYAGTYKAIDLSDDSTITGSALLDVNFAFDSAELIIDAPVTGSLFQKTYFDASSLMGDISSYGEFHATQRDDANGKMSGKFYGINGLSAGGAFTLFDQGTILSKGVYEVGNGVVLPTKMYLGGGVGVDNVDKVSMGIEDISLGTKFYTQNSWIEETDATTSNKWKYTISTPTSYTSISNFTSSFLSISVLEDGGNAITNISEPTTNTFNATDDDLNPADEMSWGEWNVAFTYDQDNVDTGISRDVSGLWTSGVETTTDAIANYSIDGVVYDGSYKAIDINDNNNIVSGVSRLDVNFGADTATLTIRNTTNEYDWGVFDITGIKANASLDGSQQGADGITRGHLVGATGNDAAGDFTIYESSTLSAKGVYQVHTNTNLSGN